MSDQNVPEPGATPAADNNPPGAAAQWEPPAIAEMARLFPGHEILELLGRGPLGAVYKARERALDRLVAIKLLPLEISTDPDFAEAFARVARDMAGLVHPNIVAVQDFDTTSDGHLFIVMEFVEGANLRNVIHQVGLAPDQALWLTGEICAALACAHSAGVIHGDLNPSNVLVDSDNRVKVADFGLGRLTAAIPAGMAAAESDYLAPEQKAGTGADHRADIFSAGVLLYEMICRELPRGECELPSQRSACDPRIDGIVLTALHESPERRYQTAEQMETSVESARTPTPGVEIPERAAAGPRAVAPVALARAAAGSRMPLYAGATVLVAAAVVAIGMAMRDPTPKPIAGPGEISNPSQPPPDSPGPNPVPPPLPEPPKEPAPPPPVPVPPPEPPVTPPVTPPVPARNATETWLADQEPKWRAAFIAEVSAPFEAAATALKNQHFAALDAQLSAALRAGQLEAAVALRDEVKRLTDGGSPLAADDPATSVAIKAIRADYRRKFDAIEAIRAASARTVQARYDAILANNQTLLTQRQRFDEALLLRAKREELAALWSRPPSLPGAPAEPPVVNPLDAPKPALPPSSPPGPDEKIASQLKGTWLFHWEETGWENAYTFNADGTYTGQGISKAGSADSGTWKIAEDKILMEAPDTAPKTILLPIDPKGTKVTDARKGRHISAVRQAPGK